MRTTSRRLVGDPTIVLWLALGLFVIAITVNCVSVALQKRYRVYDHLGRWDWSAHIVLLVVVWGTAIGFMGATVVVGPPISWPLPAWVRPFGLIVAVAASVIFGLAIRELGAQSLFNGNFFGRGRPYTERSVYGLLADPMYVAYSLSFVSLALRQADAVYLLFLVVSIIGLNVVETRVERVDVLAGSGPGERDRHS